MKPPPNAPAKRPTRKIARPITAKYLDNVAAFYLERYPSTAEGLRRVLNRRVRKAQVFDAPVILKSTCGPNTGTSINSRRSSSSSGRSGMTATIRGCAVSINRSGHNGTLSPA